MLNDADRNTAFQKSIERAIGALEGRGSEVTILDVGTGE
jgi:hypothetical protein